MLTLAIDFDGTIVENAYPEIGNLKPNVVEVMNRLRDEGYRIVINTCRTGQHELNARICLNDNNIPFHYLNENTLESRLEFTEESRKLSADIYIDDRNLLGIPDDWEKIYDLITEAKNKHIERNVRTKEKTSNTFLNK